ncbi:MAG: site-2 protease family protein [Planctomycetota bacterium]
MLESIPLYCLFYFILLYSVILHECAHAVAAYKLGDPTAYLAGRITLNPIKHIDLFNTIIMPLVTYIVLHFPFGGAKPVPINHYNFRNPDKGMMISSLAGPLSNFSLAILGFIAFFLSVKILPMDMNIFYAYLIQAINRGDYLLTNTPPPILLHYFHLVFFILLILINIILGIFNLIPIPPLDGSRVLRYLVPWHMKETLDRIEPFGLIIVLIFIMGGGTIFIGRILYYIYWLLVFIDI